MNRLIWKLLREHISTSQLAGFFFANLFGMLVVLLSVQFYYDVIPLFTQGDSFMKADYIIASKKISALGSMNDSKTTFSENEIDELEKQPFVKQIGRFSPALFKVSAGLSVQQAGIDFSTDMFFESVPDAYVDVNLTKWHYAPNEKTIPIIVPRNYLNLYNFGFAQSRSLPKITEGLMGLIQLDILIQGHSGQVDSFKGNIVGLSNRLNTILVPQTFMDWANQTYAPTQKALPSRLIVDVKNPGDPTIANYFKEHRLETENNSLDAGKGVYFLRMITGIVIGIGIFISVLSFYILTLSIFLLLQKNTVKLQNLLLIGYSSRQVALPYNLLAVGLNMLILCFSIAGVAWLRAAYLDVIREVFPALATQSLIPCILVGVIIFIAVSVLNIVVIQRKISQLFR